MTGRFQAQEIYEVEGWHRDPFLSPDGRYFVAGYDGLNLAPLDVSPDQIMISIYDRGKLTQAIRLSQLFNSLQSLRRTASHFEWGRISGVTNDLAIVETTEGPVYVELEMGNVFLPNLPPSKF